MDIMDTIETILTRRSIRKYKENFKIDDEDIKTILKCGMHAPSARNQQIWHFVVIDDQNILNQIPKIQPYSNMIKNASLGILICADLNIEKSSDYWVQDCSAATQNILLASHALGLGAVWLGVYPRQERVDGIIDLIKLPNNVKPLSLISIGKPNESIKSEDRFIENRIHINKW